MSIEERAAARDILEYLQKQPDAKHTAEGIAKYWIFQQRVEEKVEIVTAAIDYLVHEKFLEEMRKTNGLSYFKVNKKKIKDIDAILQTLQEKLPSWAEQSRCVGLIII